MLECYRFVIFLAPWSCKRRSIICCIYVSWTVFLRAHLSQKRARSSSAYWNHFNYEKYCPFDSPAAHQIIHYCCKKRRRWIESRSNLENWIVECGILSKMKYRLNNTQRKCIFERGKRRIRLKHSMVWLDMTAIKYIGLFSSKALQ